MPFLAGNITVQGLGADITSIEVDPGAPLFRFLHVAPGGTLKLSGLSLNDGTRRFPSGVTGGAIFNRGILTISSTSISRFSAIANGDGIFNMGTLTITRSIIARNLASTSGGGGVFNAGTARILASTVSQNALTDAKMQGGGIQNAVTGNLDIINSIIAENSIILTLGAGAGIGNDGILTMTSSTVANNVVNVDRSPGEGGGIFNTGTLTITNGTIAGNEVGLRGGGKGCGISNRDGTVKLVNTIVASNTATAEGNEFPTAKGPDCFGRITSLGNNLIGDSTDCTIDLQPTDLTGNPGLGEFTDDGTPRNGHFPLLTGSQAIGAANPALCPTTDQLGFPRVGQCDIGSVNLERAMLVAIDVSPRTEANKINPNSSQVAIFSTNGFDSTTVDPNTVRFGATGTNAAPIDFSLRDIDRDGRRDMVLRFQIQETGIKCGDSSAILIGQISSGPSIIGSSPISTVHCGKNIN